MNDRYKYVSFEVDPNPSPDVVTRPPEEGKTYIPVKLANGSVIYKEVFHKDFRWAVVLTRWIDTKTETETCWRTIWSPDSVCQVTVINNKILFQRTHRPMLGGNFLECPAGCLNTGENKQSAASRETAEEAGISGTKTYYDLGGAYLDNGKSDEFFGFAVSVIENPTITDRALEEGELIDEQIYLTSEEVRKGLLNQMCGGDFYDGLTLSGHTYSTLLSLYFYETELSNKCSNFTGIFFT